MKDFSKHAVHYFPLLAILIVGVIAFASLSYDRAFQVIVSVGVAISYVVWGLVHHHLHKDLHLPVVIEYVAVAVLGLAIVFSLIFRV